ncbi:MAG: hypothetical protein EBZ77_10290 [Chitinophagia bacterium]|nr:hypothetical protein [Chitinophagia bacterium]
MDMKPSPAFIGASWAALVAGMGAFFIGLYNAPMNLSEKGYYFTVLMYGLYSAISLQKAVRDQIEGIKVSQLYYGISWFSTILLKLADKGFFGMAFGLSLFAVIAVQKNVRDLQAVEKNQQSAN